ncbi:MAG: hypothetical protein WC848_05985 [Parcubacteria group bacterium]|jgi:hypothetical protein
MNFKIIKLKIFFLAILFFAIFGMSSKASAATYYVKNGGNDSLSGIDDANAWAHCPGMVEWTGSTVLTSGDVVYFNTQGSWISELAPTLITKTGVTYRGKGYGTGTQQRAFLKAINNGTDPTKSYGVVQIGVSNVLFGGFEIDGGSTNVFGIDACHTFATADFGHIAIDDNVVHDCGSAAQGSNGIYIGTVQPDGLTVSDITMTNNVVYNSGWGGISVYPTWARTAYVRDVIIRNNEVYNSSMSADKSSGGLRLKDDITNLVAEYNNIHDNYYGVTVECSEYESTKCMTGVTLRHNLIYSSRYSGISFTPRGFAIEMDIYGNIIYNSGSSGSPVSTGVHFTTADYGLVRDSKNSIINFYNNTVAQISTTNTDYTQGQCITTGGVVTGLTANVRNNIFWQHQNNKNTALIQSDVLNHSNNLYYQDNALSHPEIKWVQVDASAYDASDLASWETSGVQVTNPLFTGGELPTGFSGTYGTDMAPNADYFKITSGDALNNGATLGSPYDGNINTAGTANPIARIAGAYDIGAYEYQGTDIISPSAPSGLSVN